MGAGCGLLAFRSARLRHLPRSSVGGGSGGSGGSSGDGCGTENADVVGDFRDGDGDGREERECYSGECGDGAADEGCGVQQSPGGSRRATIYGRLRRAEGAARAQERPTNQPGGLRAAAARGVPHAAG